MSDLGNIGQFFSQIGPDIGSALSTGFKDIGSLVQGIPGDISGLFGGGGAVSPGTLGASASQLSMPSMATDAGTVAAGSSALPGGAGAFSTGPGLPDPTAGIVSPSSIDMSGLPSGGDAQSILSNINPQGAMATANLSSMDPNSVLAQATGVAPGGATQLTGATGGGGNFLQNLLKNPKLLGEGGLLAAELLNANRTPAGEAQLKALASQQAGFAKNQGELAQAEQQGILPAGATQLFQGQLNAAEAAIRAKYAQMGMTGSTAEMQDLQAAREGIMGQMFQQGQQMAQQGWTNVNQATGYESQLLDEILASETAQGTQLGQALAAFAGAAAK